MRYLILLSAFLAASTFAQTPGNCERGVAQGDLDANDVFARVFNTGALFFGNSTTFGNGYLVPKNTGNSPLFASGLWVGGKVNGQIRVAGGRYTRLEFWPGPLNTGAVLPNPTDCSAYDRIFVVSRDDVVRYLQTGEATDDLRDWPADWGAPVLDGDGIEGNYNLAGGDQPAIYGDQTAWWIMNDVGNVHEETGSNPLGIEVRVSASALDRGMRALDQATFYHFDIINRSANTIDSAYVSLFMDPDLGDAADDWIGSDTTMSMAFVMNGDNDDAIYGIPPAQGYQLVQGPVGLPNGRDDDGDGATDEPGERLGLTASTYFTGGANVAAMNDPRTKDEYYHHMQGRWKDGAPFTAAGPGYATEGPVTTFVFPGDPVTNQCWSARNDCLGASVLPNDHRVVIHTGPFRLGPGESTDVAFALPFAQGADNIDSVAQLRLAAHTTRAAWETGLLEAQRIGDELPAPVYQLRVSAPFPNPFTDGATIRYELAGLMPARMAVYDVLGREVAVLVDADQPAGSYEVDFNGADLAPGIYIVRFEAAGEEETFSVVKLRP